MAQAVQSSENLDALSMQPIFSIFEMDRLSTSCPEILVIVHLNDTTNIYHACSNDNTYSPYLGVHNR